MGKKQQREQARKCFDCEHYYACSTWNIGTLQYTDATNCANYEESMVLVRLELDRAKAKIEKMAGPKLFITYEQGGETIKRGPYWTITPDGNGAAIGEEWTAYSVQPEPAVFRRLIIPTKYHTIITRDY